MRHVRLAFIASLLLLLNACSRWSAAPPVSSDVRDIVGVCHINSFYNFTTQDFLNEGADQVLTLGSRVIKVILRDELEGYYKFNTQWPHITSLQQAAETPYFQELFAKPFSTYVLMIFTPGKPIHYFTAGMAAADIQREEQEFYAFTKFLLTRYRGSGKTFILQNWEGDWVLTPPPPDMEKVPTAVAIQGMIDWLNARQDGVERARREAGTHGVMVAHAAEVNQVEKAMAGKPTVTNSVLPHTHCDLYSYSSYDSLVYGPQRFRAALEYLQSKAPASPLYGRRNLYVGEYGWPESVVGETERLRMLQSITETALNFGVRYALFWELYDDGPKHPLRGRPANDDMVGNWLIRPDGSKSLLWDYFSKLFRNQKQSIARTTH
jgi:hypothetical protein